MKQFFLKLTHKQFEKLFVYVLMLSMTGCMKPSSEPLEPKPHLPAPLVVIDAGHGGKDGGTQSSEASPTLEKHLNLFTAKLIQSKLSEKGYRTLLTRGDDTFIPLDVRCAIANGNEANLFVSIHYNAAPNPKASGIEIYTYNDIENGYRLYQSKRCAEIILNTLIAATQAHSRGLKQEDFRVIRKTNMPAILIEAGFLTNVEELKKLKDPNYLLSIANAVTEGVDTYFRTNDLR